ncbi:uncharacterized protein LOC133818688 isoform X2 [Humulus lupulus]|uniref:uncharacterized protein LOC133818688 isoform X2 n=1 Tax=Humulus lupulus TaxID=3486 RepID=UPI002B40B5B4|nr:uncharacterized protein LOC133818688 isoform X2 [Humulus lupulus]
MTMASNIKVPIFADTNLGTRIAMAVPPEITAVDFKRKLERVHCKCFAGSGDIEVCGLMVKKKSCFYYLPDSIPMKYAFQGVRGTWFLHVEVKTSTKCFAPCLLGLAVENSFASADKSITKDERKKYQDIELQSHKSPLEEGRYAGVSTKKTKRERIGHFLDNKSNGNEIKCTGSGTKTAVLNANKSSDHSASVKEVEPPCPQASTSMTEVSSEMFSDAKSVTSIIKRYFPDSNEISNFSSSDATSKIRKRRKKYLKTKLDDRVESFPKFAEWSPSNVLPFPLPITPPQEILEGKTNGPEVGKRLQMASNNLGSSGSKKKTAIYFCRSRDIKVLGFDNPLAKWSVFEISDSDD